jgi:hypothetical protein
VASTNVSQNLERQWHDEIKVSLLIALRHWPLGYLRYWTALASGMS